MKAVRETDIRKTSNPSRQRVTNGEKKQKTKRNTSERFHKGTSQRLSLSLGSGNRRPTLANKCAATVRKMKTFFLAFLRALYFIYGSFHGKS